MAGDYSTYDGLRIGLLRRHTYNDKFIAFTEEKGFNCEILYYETLAELSNALIHDEVDAIVNSYIGTPEDERVVESRMGTLAVLENNSSVRSVNEQNWPGVQILVLNSLEECTREILHGRVDGALLMTYEAQRLAQQAVQNQLSVDIVPGMTLEIQMGVNARDNVLFYGLWNKTLSIVSEQISAETWS